MEELLRIFNCPIRVRFVGHGMKGSSKLHQLFPLRLCLALEVLLTLNFFALRRKLLHPVVVSSFDQAHLTERSVLEQGEKVLLPFGLRYPCLCCIQFEPSKSQIQVSTGAKPHGRSQTHSHHLGLYGSGYTEYRALLGF